MANSKKTSPLGMEIAHSTPTVLGLADPFLATGHRDSATTRGPIGSRTASSTASGRTTVDDVPAIMHAKNWLKGEALMKYWFAGTGSPNSTDITMDWVLGFKRAKLEYDRIFSEKLYVTEKARAEIVKLAKSRGVFEKGGQFGDASGSAEKLDPSYTQFVVVGSVLDDFDDLYAALGRFTFRIVVHGGVVLVGKERYVSVSKIGVYVRDSYDFVGNQALGYWDKETNYVGTNPFKGSLITNAAFRNTKKGADFIVYSDVRTTNITPFYLFPAS